MTIDKASREAFKKNLKLENLSRAFIKSIRRLENILSLVVLFFYTSTDYCNKNLRNS